MATDSLPGARDARGPTAGIDRRGGAVREAASVVLVRARPLDARMAPGRIEVFLQRRVASMAFAPGMTVFPGGGVELADLDTGLPWQGPDVQSVAQALKVTTDSARGSMCAAIRETFEECGVLLASTRWGEFPEADDLAEARAALESKRLHFSAMLRGHGLVLRTDLLVPMARWITPEGEPLRYDTRFFLAALPPGQFADGRTSEASASRWMMPAAALAAWQARSHLLLPPTWAQLVDLAQCPSVESALLRRRHIVPITPEPITDRGNRRVAFPGDVDYYRQTHSSMPVRSAQSSNSSRP